MGGSILTSTHNVTDVVTPAPGFRRDRGAGVQNSFFFLDSGWSLSASGGPE